MQKKDFLQKRKYIRLTSIFPVELFIPLPSFKNKNKLVQGFTQDVSLGGLCLKINDPDPDVISFIKDKKTTFDIHINMPISHRPIEARVCVAWHEIDGKHRHDQLKIGVFYEKIAQKDKKAIVNAARRMKWLPKIAFILIIGLASLLAFSFYNTKKIVAKNRALIEKFYSIQETSNTYREDSDKIGRLYNTLMTELNMKEKKIKALELKLNDTLTAGTEAPALGKISLEEDLRSLQNDKALLEQKIKNVLEKKKTTEVLLDEAREERKKLEEATLNNMYQWLRSHQNSVTGLIMSFEGDPAIKNWGFTYDQSLASQVFLISGDRERSSKILSFFKKRAKKTKGAYSNAYNVVSGNPVEYTVNVGPNVWIGIAALQYTHATGDKTYLGIAEDIAKWLISIKDNEGGLRGGPGLPWYSTEHNLDAYAFFSMLYDITRNDIYKRHMNQTLKWIKDNTYSAKTGGMKRGKGDATIATDTLAWSIAAIGPARLFKEGMHPEGIIKFAEENCLVKTTFTRPDGSVAEVNGFDFGKSRHLARGGVVSTEWTAQMIMAFRIMADYFQNEKEPGKAKEYREKAGYFLNELDKMVISSPSWSGQGAGCLPYASQPKADTGHGWRTPKGRLTGSVAGTAYTIFAKKNHNPLALD